MKARANGNDTTATFIIDYSATSASPHRAVMAVYALYAGETEAASNSYLSYTLNSSTVSLSMSLSTVGGTAIYLAALQVGITATVDFLSTANTFRDVSFSSTTLCARIGGISPLPPLVEVRTTAGVNNSFFNLTSWDKKA
jgi:hypothetical protein